MITREMALSMIEEYDEYSQLVYEDGHILHGIRGRFPKDGGITEAMRWLGFCQGVLYAAQEFTLEELKEHTRRGEVMSNDDVQGGMIE